VLFSSYSFTWEGGLRERTPGGSSINSGEARDFQLGGCVDRLACTSCHDPHGPDDPDRLRFIASPAGNSLCDECHEQYATPATLTAHTHHAADGAGSACVACHMPKKNMGLDYELTRYHRIASPTDVEKVMKDRPLECALCHPGSSLEQLTATMERWWGKRYDRQELTGRYGSLEQNAVVATLERGKPHEQAVALALLDPSLHAGALELATGQFDNRYPLVRYYARAAVQRLTGRRLPVDMSLPASELAAAVEKWLATAEDFPNRAGTDQTRSSVNDLAASMRLHPLQKAANGPLYR
jgi:predicted CXXCH cytochrome family protein